DLAGKNIAAPYFTSPSRLPDAAPGIGYSQQLTTILGSGPTGFSLSAGLLPPGMTVSAAGLFSWSSDTPRTFRFTLLATYAAGASTDQLCVLRVLQPVAVPVDIIGWWRGEPNAGGTVSGEIGGHDGGFFHGKTPMPPTVTSDGKVGSALVFDGTVNVQIPD